MSAGIMSRKWGLLFVLLLVCGAGLIYLSEKRPIISDSLGYLVAAERLSDGNGLNIEDPLNVSAGPYFSLYAFQIRRVDRPERQYLGFPPGLPILLSAGIKLVGLDISTRVVIPLFAMLGLLGTFLLGQTLSGRTEVGLVAAGVLATTAVFWRFGTAIWSEIPSMAFVALGYYAFLRSRQTQSDVSRLLLWSFLASLFMVYSFFLRYANVFLLPALGLYDLWVTGGMGFFRRPKLWLVWGLIVLGLGGMLLFNHFYYGGVLVTSYSPVHGWYPQSPFSIAYAWGPSFVNGYSLREGLLLLWRNFPGVVLLVPVGWLLMKRPFGFLIATATISIILFYGIYAFAPVGVNSRFLLPIFPLLSISIAQALVAGWERISWLTVRVVGVITILLLLLWSMPATLLELNNRNQNSEETAANIAEIVSFTEAEAVILTYHFNDLVWYYGDRSVLNYRRIPPSDEENGRFQIELLEPCLVQTINRLLAQGIPVYYFVDDNPTFWRSFEIVQANYDLAEAKVAPPIFQLHTQEGIPQTTVGCPTQ